MRVMSLRAGAGALMLCGLSACGSNPDSASSLEEAEAQVQANAAEEGRIACAVGGAAFANACTVERDTSEGMLMLTIRHPDGGFRRFKVEKGVGVVAADGAEPAAVTPVGPKLIEVTVAGDKYRLPATVKASEAKAAPPAEATAAQAPSPAPEPAPAPAAK